MEKTFASKLKNPGATFRGAPFWAWNAKLEPSELRRQIRIMNKMGMGGFFMHSRVGLNTPYLSDDWFKCIDACVDEAKKLGMDAWLYDEDRWPSGAAGGFVTKIFPEFRSRSLDCNFPADPVDPKGSTEGADLAWFAVTGRVETMLAGYRRVDGPDAKLGDGESLLRFFEKVAKPSPWYNDGTYLDTLNKDAVAKFIEITHEKYNDRINSDFGATVPGIFSDEPNVSGYLSWTGSLPDVFRAMHGYDLMDRLPEVCFVVGGETFSKVRLDYKETVTQLFVEAFSKQIGEWCGKHNLEFTGHVLGEDNFNDQANCTGEAMRFYEYMQAPGIDLLTEHWQIFRTAKQCTSMAHQFGRRRRLSETNGCTGWDFPLEGHKALADWQIALGINLRCQHLAWYSMGATAKRDYPASIFRQSPWHDVYSANEDYFARIGETLFGGDFEEVRELLVVHPIESVWGVKSGRAASAAATELDEAFVRLGGKLLGANIDFDYGSEEVMSRHSRVKGKKFNLAKASYKAVLLPRMLTIRSSTLKLLEDFAKAGGGVFYVGTAPERVDGVVSKAAAKAFKNFTQCTEEDVAAAVAPLARRVSITQDGVETEATLHLLSKRKSGLALFVCNTSAEMPKLHTEMNFKSVRERDIEYPGAVLKVFTRRCGDVYEIDPSTGEIHRVDAEYARGAYVIPCPLWRLESRLFIITDDKLGKTRAPRKRRGELSEAVKLPEGKIKIALSEPNAIVLDHARCSVDGGTVDEEKFILQIDTDLRKMLGADPRGGQMVQPWVAGESKPDRDLGISLSYAFKCDKIPAKPIELGIERPDLYEISLNGKKVKQDDAGYWMDPAIRRIKLPRPRKGENELVLKGRYHQFLPGLEAVYVLGEFGVRDENVMTAAPETLDIGDWVGQGLDNYSGNVTYTFHAGARPATRKRVFLRFPEWRGAALGVRVNDGEEALLAWPPYDLDVTDMLKDSRNTVKVKVYGHRRNVCGPFYLKDVKWPSWTGPAQMQQHEVRERGLVPCGLLKPVEFAY